MGSGGNGSLSAVNGCQKSSLICKLLLIPGKRMSMSAWEGSISGIFLPAVDHIELYSGQRSFGAVFLRKENNFDIVLGVLNPKVL